jgi:hypothetical protein
LFYYMQKKIQYWVTKGINMKRFQFLRYFSFQQTNFD